MTLGGRGPGGVADQVVVAQPGLVHPVADDEPAPLALAALPQLGLGLLHRGVALGRAGGAGEHPRAASPGSVIMCTLSASREEVPGQPGVHDRAARRRLGDVPLELVDVAVDGLVELRRAG